MVIQKEKMDEIVEGNKNDSSDMEKQYEDNESETGSSKDSVSSQGDLMPSEEQKVVNRTLKKQRENDSGKISRVAASKHGRDIRKTVPSVSKSNRKSSVPRAKGYTNKDVEKNKAPSKTSSETSEGPNERLLEDVSEISKIDEPSNGNNTHSVKSDEEDDDTADPPKSVDGEEDDSKIKQMELQIEKLQEELREVAALEISIYSVIPEHGSSAHKVHTPARRLSRLYIHACKHWTQDKRATVAKNTVAGLVLVSKSCGNDVARLTFWLSNLVVLREIIHETFGTSRHPSPVTKFSNLNRSDKKNDGRHPIRKGASDGKPLNKQVLLPLLTDWQEIGTFTSAIENVESWIFSRTVESVWWQTLAPNMQSCNKDHNKYSGRVSGPNIGDQHQGNLSMTLWQNAFNEAFQRLCPVRSAGHECGCLPVLARMVLDQCVARLDIAMFNAILRESVHEIPTDPISDPIVDPKVLPIPAGELSFGSGAQLKNSIGTWSQWLSDLVGMDTKNSSNNQQQTSEDDSKSDTAESISFPLLNALSDLLMLPKDMLMDRSIRKEVCPSISLSLVKRILCNFTPDEFCPDPVPGTVLEALNAESIVERRLSGEASSSFPYKAGPVIYTPPNTSDVSGKVAEVGARSHLMRNASLVQKKGYTSDDELQELRSPLGSIIDKLPLCPAALENRGKFHTGNGNEHASGCYVTNTRYELLGEVWYA